MPVLNRFLSIVCFSRKKQPSKRKAAPMIKPGWLKSVSFVRASV
ncbi:hypothetical protein BAXH7_02793 [Bacillus amyloliquefaciens XH7]|nr:hypothetical protein BAXH7_02793 [Bacillus amyloliquefaciens XH7]